MRFCSPNVYGPYVDFTTSDCTLFSATCVYNLHIKYSLLVTTFKQYLPGKMENDLVSCALNKVEALILVLNTAKIWSLFL